MLKKFAVIFWMLVMCVDSVMAQQVSVGFCAHNNFVHQYNWIRGQYKKIEWSHEYGDDYGDFTNGVWTPVHVGEQPAIVQFSGQLQVCNAPQDPLYCYVATIFKNGRLLQPFSKANIGAIGGGHPNVQIITIAGWDVAQPGDNYSIHLYSASTTAMLDGTPAHTWWAGTAIVE